MGISSTRSPFSRWNHRGYSLYFGEDRTSSSLHRVPSKESHRILLPQGKGGAGSCHLAACPDGDALTSALTLAWPAGHPLAFWVVGGTALVVMYNCATPGMAFVKELCSTCRLRPLIEEHEAMHLEGESCEGPVWSVTKQRYSYDGLGLGNDPRICSFCPIAKHLKEN